MAKVKNNPAGEGAASDVVGGDGHHPECDHWRSEHVEIVQTTYDTGAKTWQAVCRDCDWKGTTVGRGALSLANKEAAEHGRFTQCVGECLTWDED